MNYSSHPERGSSGVGFRGFDPVESWLRVALQAAEESDPNKLLQFSRELQRKLNSENGAPHHERKQRLSLAKRKST
jgi:hypothetical protein